VATVTADIKRPHLQIPFWLLRRLPRGHRPLDAGRRGAASGVRRTASNVHGAHSGGGDSAGEQRQCCRGAVQRAAAATPRTTRRGRDGPRRARRRESCGVPDDEPNGGHATRSHVEPAAAERRQPARYGRRRLAARCRALRRRLTRARAKARRRRGAGVLAFARLTKPEESYLPGSCKKCGQGPSAAWRGAGRAARRPLTPGQRSARRVLCPVGHLTIECRNFLAIKPATAAAAARPAAPAPGSDSSDSDSDLSSSDDDDDDDVPPKRASGAHLFRPHSARDGHGRTHGNSSRMACA